MTTRAMLGGMFLAAGVLAARAETIVFYDFTEGTAGTAVGTVPNRGTAGDTFNGTASAATGGGVAYSDDVPGKALYAGQDATTPLTTDWKSLEFTVDGNNGAIITVPNLGKHLCELGTTGDFTIEFFAKFAVSQNWKDLVKFFFKASNDNYQQAKYVLWGTTFGLQNASANPTCTSAQAGLWYHLAAVYTAADGAWRMYCNGMLYATQVNAILGASGTTQLTLGGQSTNYETFAGQLAALRISSEALAPAQFMKVRNGAVVSAPDTVAFYPFDEAAAGTDVSTVHNMLDALGYSGGAAQVNGGAMPAYSDDVPGYWLYSDTSYTNLLSSTANAVKFAPAEGVSNSGGLITLSQLATAMSALDEGTVEFFAESDANLAWRNMITFNAGQNFKVCYSGSSFQFQNFWRYNVPDSCLAVSIPASSGRWLHAAVTWSKQDNRARCYADYVLKGSVYLTNVTTTASRPLYVGGSGSESESFCGKVFGLRVSSRELAPAEMLRVTTFPMHGNGVLVSKDGASSTHASTIVIDAGKKLKIRSGVALTADRVTAGGTAVAAGLYTGEAGAEGATVVDWIDGTGTLAVTGTSETSTWMTAGDGNWSDAANWSDAILPRAGHPAAIDMPMPVSYSVTVDGAVAAPSSLLVANGSTATATVNVVAGGSVKFQDASLQVGVGGVVQTSGGDFLATNTPVTVADGGVVRVTSGTFRVVDAAANAFTLQSGARLELAGGTTEILNGSGGGNVFNMAAGSSLKASGDATLNLYNAKKNNYLRGSEILFSDDARVTVYHCSFGALGGAAQTVTFRDRAAITFRNDAVLSIGAGVPGPVVMNLDSSAQTKVPYGVVVGSTAGSTLNIRNGHCVRGTGNWNAIASSSDSAPRGTVNVCNGAFVQQSFSQWPDCPYGITVGENKGNAASGAVGVLNVYREGVVSNLTTSTLPGAGVYLRVGSGRYGDGTINQYGGEVYHDSNLGCLIGAWGGTGRWNVSSGGVATVLCDVYVGGAETNSLVAFGPSAAPGSGRGNGGAAFGKYYDAYALSTGTLVIENGSFATPSNLLVSALGTGTVRMGAAGRLAAKDVVLGRTVEESSGTVHNTTVAFDFGKDAAGTIAASGRLTVAEGTKLILDFTAFEKGKATRFPLITYASREGDFAEGDIEIVGDTPKTGTLLKDVPYRGGSSYQYALIRGTVLIIR